MKVHEVQAIFDPIAKQVLDKGLTLPQAVRALETVIVLHALNQHGGQQVVVSNFLGVSPAVISRIVLGTRVPPKDSDRKHKSWQKRHGGSPQQVLGGIEL